MKILKSRRVKTCDSDDPLYYSLIALFNQIKLIQGNTELNYTLRNHSDITLYLISKQIDRIKFIEETYFNEDGSVNVSAVSSSFGSLQK